jgi:pimeloyl-ACP methyl ester carboxylesterase
MPETFEIKSDIYAETPVWFADHTLFGILCRPQVPQSRVIVLIGNSSGDPHCGDTTADLARNLAEGGVASLRFDFRGLGDSDNIDGQCSHIFEVDRTPDYSAAIDFLEQRGFEQFAVYGLCSGAYHAYLAAVQEQRLSYGLFVNMPFFHWVHGFPVEDLVLDRRKPTYFLDHMRTSAFWAFVAYKILRGDFNLRNRLAWLRRLKPTRRQVATVDEALARRVKMLFVVCEGDTSIDVLKQEFGDPPPAGKKVELVPGLNHAMTGAIMRRLVASRFISFLESFPGTALKSDMLN